MDEPKTTQEELVYNLEAVEITVTKKTTGEALCCNGSDPENYKSDHTFTIIMSMLFFGLVCHTDFVPYGDTNNPEMNM